MIEKITSASRMVTIAIILWMPMILLILWLMSSKTRAEIFEGFERIIKAWKNHKPPD